MIDLKAELEGAEHLATLQSPPGPGPTGTPNLNPQESRKEALESKRGSELKMVSNSKLGKLAHFFQKYLKSKIARRYSTTLILSLII